MLKLFTDVLDKTRLDTWEKLANFKSIGVLAGGTALALQLNHRRSFDFDIFSLKTIPKNLLLKLRKTFAGNELEIVVDSAHELTVLLKQEIKISFVFFPFKSLHETIKTKSLDLFDVKDLLSNKTYAVGRRGAWRDYADIYYGLSHQIVAFPKLISETEKRFQRAFSQKLFLEQLTYFNDINDWTIDWVKEKTEKEEIKKYLHQQVEKYLSYFSSNSSKIF